MRDSTTLQEVSSTLTPVAKNVVRQGPGGQAYDLAPTTLASNRFVTPVTATYKFKKRAKADIARLARVLGGTAVRTLSPIVRHPALSSLVGVAAIGTVTVFFLKSRR